MKYKIFSVFALFITLLTLGCDSKHVNNDEEIITRDRQRFEGFGKFFGEDTLLFGKGQIGREPDVGIGVNTYLWRATLDTLSFMPLRSVDPFGGVILTNWYENPSCPGERLRVDVRILDRVLRADALKISVFREKLVGGKYKNDPVTLATITELEDAILTRARQLKIADTF